MSRTNGRPGASDPAEAYAEAATAEPGAWQIEALCAQTDPESFFPEKGVPARAAQAVCRRCEVRAECLQWALQHDQRYGIWGGTTEMERRRMRRAARQVLAQMPTGGEAA